MPFEAKLEENNRWVVLLKNCSLGRVRPILRGKAKAKTEFGAKINISLLDGYARVDHFHWDALNEGQDLQSQVERFRKLTGKYPELVQVDKIYLTL